MPATPETTHVAKEIGSAKVMADVPLSDGSTALEILNFRKTALGTLESRFRVCPFINPDHATALTGIPAIFTAGTAASPNGCVGMGYMMWNGSVPELLFLTHDGVFRYAPWLRASAPATNPLLEQQYYYSDDLSSPTQNVVPQGEMMFPPQCETVGNRIYFTFCDGGGAWVWDRERLRRFGYTEAPCGPAVQGPTQGESENGGGFATRGRIGTFDSDWTRLDGAEYVVVGGVDEGEWDYYCVFENADGAYSATSTKGGTANMRRQLCSTSDGAHPTPETLGRRWRVWDVPTGPPGTAARILLRTANKRRLPDGDFGYPRFLHRMPGNKSQEWIDDIPDAELGAAWAGRELAPFGFYLLKSFGGSMFMGRTDGNPSRVWWSEQGNPSGPTPESIMQGHWRDVYPSTGAITAMQPAFIGDGSGNPVLLVFKERATHYLSGQYPDWNIGTIHEYAGCAGPGCVQSLPDGTTVWYGNRTFWRLDRSGNVTDIGAPIRRRLQRVNWAAARRGVSFVKQDTMEAFFSLPVGESATNNYQFVWDYQENGWRCGDNFTLLASCYIHDADIVLVSGTYGPSGGPRQNVWVWDAADYNQEIGVARCFGVNQAVYQTGWVSFDDTGSRASFNVASAVVTGMQAYEGEATVEAFRNWDRRTSTITADASSLTLASPQDTSVAFWTDTADSDFVASNIAVAGEDIYGEQTPYFCRVRVDATDTEVFSMKLTIPAGEVMDLAGITAFGTRLASGGRRAERAWEA